MCLELDSRLLYTERSSIRDFGKLLSGMYDEKLDRGFLAGLLLLSLVISLIFVIASRTRFDLKLPFLTAVLLCAPAVAAEIAGFYPGIVIFAAAVFGLEAVGTSYELDGKFVFGSPTAARPSVSRQETAYRRRTRGFILNKKLGSDIPRYNRYSGNAVSMAVLSGLVFAAAALCIPEGRGLSYKDVFEAVERTVTSAVDSLGNMLGTSFGTADDKGYFSFSSYGDISGSISIEPPGDSDLPVLEVTLTRNDIPVYLRGDIGVDFSGSSWNSVQDVYAGAAEKYRISEGFYPELTYRVFRQRLAAAGYAPDDIIPLQTVSVRYLRNTRVVFQPLAPYDLNYKKNEYYESSGDFILRTKQGFIKTHESLALTPGLSLPGFSVGADDLSAVLFKVSQVKYSTAAADYFRFSGFEDIGYDEYMTSLYDYEALISELYGSDSVPGLINGFIAEIGASRPYTPEDICGQAQLICDKFRDDFSYSLTTDNGEEPLTAFLEETHEGHCALFASAMTLAMRELGVPARYITGYVVYGPGERSASGYDYVLTERNLHAWTEIYLEGIGWIPYDPTAAVPGYMETVTGQVYDPEITEQTTQPLPETQPSEEEEPELTEETEEEPVSVPGDEPEEEADPESGGEYVPVGTPHADIFALLLPYLAAAAVAAAIAVTAVMFVRSLEKAEKKKFRSFASLPEHEAVADMYRFLLKLLEKEKTVPENEQMYEFARRADAKLTSVGANVFMSDIVPLIEKNEFGDPERSPVTPEERELMCAFAAEVYNCIMDSHGRFSRFFMKISLFL